MWKDGGIVAHLHSSSRTTPQKHTSRNAALSRPCGTETLLGKSVLVKSSSRRCRKVSMASQSPTTSCRAAQLIPCHWDGCLQAPAAHPAQFHAARARGERNRKHLGRVGTSLATPCDTIGPLLQLTFSPLVSMGQKSQLHWMPPLSLTGCSDSLVLYPRPQGAATAAAGTTPPRSAKVNTRVQVKLCSSGFSSADRSGGNHNRRRYY